jgi:phosphopentomutase
MRRALILLLDGVGIGELPDAAQFGDTGSNSLANTARAVGGLNLPNLQALGLGNISPLDGCPPAATPSAAFGKMAEVSGGKDSTVGHWEISGLTMERGFPVFPNGFPAMLIAAFENEAGTKSIGNVCISGTEAIRVYGEEHLKTGSPIVYTSADSVFQVAGHEDRLPVDRLYRVCRAARKILVGDWGVARVIARPFAGVPGSFRRTARRKDFSLEPPGHTLLDVVKAASQEVSLIGKLDDLFAQRGFTRTFHSVNNMECFDRTLVELRRVFPGLLFTNLIQFDQDWGHRNDPKAYYQGLVDFDRRLPELLGLLRDGDLLFITSDHGNDPTTPSTDHSREHVPLLVCGKPVRRGVNLGTRASFADLGQTAAEYLGLPKLASGKSFLGELLR